ncbi:MAG: hypothetical protein CFH01_00689 [Alphaproteobacteria bacterium MarineAlpha2_Bin1]|nr:MAG: hypothetical protein CFH01_00689 [Alphaproteobacteria bacterium MarineAlpha2_Bin1]|tara:strand:- start:144 stop:911 length:768 start_codon:yes stop_codon:yes gene_type:complete
MRKALVIVPFALDAEGISNREKQTEKVNLGNDLKFDFKPVTAGPSSFMSPHDTALMELAIFEAGVNAEKDGYDVVIIDTMSDSGLAPLRSILKIPVVSPGKASMLVALMIGNKFGILAQWDRAVPRYNKVVVEYGLKDHCAAIDHFDEPPDFSNLLTGKEKKVYSKMKIACENMVKKGADVICLGSTTMHQAGEFLSKELDVPVINPGPLSYKLAETLLDVGLSHSKKAFPEPLVPKINMIKEMFKAAKIIEEDK